MLETIRQRGAGDRAIFTAPGIGLGACTDLTVASGSLIGANATSTIHVAADAALTNARDLRAFFERTGSIFQSHTDAELIAHAYEHWGDACVERLRGPFTC